MRLSDEAWLRARALVASRLGLDIPEHRRADLERGLVKAASHNGSMSAPDACLERLAALPGESAEWERLIGHLAIGETYFFRDQASFDALEEHVLPALIAARRADGTLRLRLWSAGCASGEEPYSLAILLDRLLPDRSRWAVTVLGTDVNPQSLAVARRGQYRAWSFRSTPGWVRDRWFHRRGTESFQVDPSIRRMVTFAPLNLAGDGYPSVMTNTSAMDLILCRNVLMYFADDVVRASVARLQQALAPSGWLAVSPVECSADVFRGLASITFTGASFYRKGPVPVTPAPPPWLTETTASSASSVPDVPLDVSVLRDVSWPPPSVKEPQEEVASGAPDVATALQRARALADEGHLDEARTLCESVPDRLDPHPHLLLAAICQEQGDIRPALAALRRAIYLAPDLAAPHFLLGSLLIREGERRRGRRAMETVVSLLGDVRGDEALPGADGLTAARVLESARMYLELLG